MNEQMDEGEKTGNESQGREKNRNRNKRVGQQKVEMLCERSEKSERKTEDRRK